MNFYNEEQIYFAFIYKNYLFTTFKNLVNPNNFQYLIIKPFHIRHNEISLKYLLNSKHYYENIFKNMIYSDDLEEFCDIDRRPIPKEILERICP